MSSAKRQKGQGRGDSDIVETAAPVDTTFEVGILVLPSVHASALYGALDILSTVGMRWDRGTERFHPKPGLRVRTVGLTTAAVQGWNGVRVHPSASIDAVAKSDIIYVPALGPPEGEVPATDPAVCRWLVEQYERGAVLATACSGSVVLAEAGLLEGEPATTHWAYTDTFAQRFPSTQLCPERALVLAGAQQRIVTAGGGSLWQELLLYLIVRFLGRDAAAHAAKLYLMDWSRQDQLPYALFQERRQHADAVIRKAQRILLERAAEADVLVRARAATGLIDRTFQRRFRAATGVTPGRYLQELRIELAKEAIVTRDCPLDDIASDVGYADPASFRRLFKRIVGISPSAYRRRMAPPL